MDEARKACEESPINDVEPNRSREESVRSEPLNLSFLFIARSFSISFSPPVRSLRAVFGFVPFSSLREQKGLSDRARPGEAGGPGREKITTVTLSLEVGGGWRSADRPGVNLLSTRSYGDRCVERIGWDGSILSRDS